jgi:DHA2 family multidrug resistance protein
LDLYLGWIMYDFVWRWIFYINVPMGILSAFLIWLYLRPYETKEKKREQILIGFVLLFMSCYLITDHLRQRTRVRLV